MLLYRLHDYNSQQISNTLYGLSCLGVVPSERWLVTAVAASAGLLRAAGPAELSNMLLSFARMGYHPGESASCCAVVVLVPTVPCCVVADLVHMIPCCCLAEHRH